MEKIGIFDSGVGGLTVLRCILDEYPNYSYIYVGDNKNNPYGDKSKKELYDFSKRIIEYFIEQKIKKIIIACNTISSNFLDIFQKEFSNITFFGVVEPTIKEALKLHKRSILIMATSKTIDSKIYQKGLRNGQKDIEIYALKMPLLVPLIEEESNLLEQEIQKHALLYKKADIILLGCTHYELVKELIRKNFSKEIISSSVTVLNDLEKYLKKGKRENLKIKIFTTGNVLNFTKVSNKIINKKVEFLDI